MAHDLPGKDGAVIWQGDSRDLLREIPDSSIDAIVTDPPYELGFMGKSWDATGIAYDVSMWRECLRVLKPGGHLLSFGGSRTYHRMACAIEDAGFEIRDQIMWIYGGGFPKSHGVSKAIDKEAGKTRERIRGVRSKVGHEVYATDEWTKEFGDSVLSPEPITEAAQQWQGWGTALKPAHEPIALARKPLIGTVAENVLSHRTGAMNIDVCRVEGAWQRSGPCHDLRGGAYGSHETIHHNGMPNEQAAHPQGRWPANVCHDGSDEVLAAFPESTTETNARSATNRDNEPSSERIYADRGGTSFTMKPGARRGDTGSAARFFYCAKASREDRNEGCQSLPPRLLNWSSGTENPGSFQSEGTNKTSANHHPTVKPTDLMRWLCRLITPRGGLILDPFAGSGTTGKAAVVESFRFIGIEQNPEYVEIARRRISHARPQHPLFASLSDD